jgi:hypothetical protein
MCVWGGRDGGGEDVIYTFMHVCCVCMHACTYIQIIYIYTYIHIYIHIYIYIYTHTHTHTHKDLYKLGGNEAVEVPLECGTEVEDCMTDGA